MNDPIFHEFLAAQFAQGLAFARQTDQLTLIPFHGDPPRQYVAEYHCQGLVKAGAAEPTPHGLWAVGIHFPEDYLRRPAIVPRILTYLGPHPDPWHPNIRPPFVCLHLQTGMPLVEILHGLYDLLTWNLYSTSDEGLNHAAAQWARHQDPARFPVDPRPLRRPRPALAEATPNPATP